MDFEGANDGDLGIFSGGPSKKIFRFDRVFTPKDDQGFIHNTINTYVLKLTNEY